MPIFEERIAIFHHAYQYWTTQSIFSTTLLIVVTVDSQSGTTGIWLLSRRDYLYHHRHWHELHTSVPPKSFYTRRFTIWYYRYASASLAIIFILIYIINIWSRRMLLHLDLHVDDRTLSDRPPTSHPPLDLHVTQPTLDIKSLPTSLDLQVPQPSFLNRSFPPSSVNSLTQNFFDHIIVDAIKNTSYLSIGSSLQLFLLNTIWRRKLAHPLLR